MWIILLTLLLVIWGSTYYSTKGNIWGALGVTFLFSIGGCIISLILIPNSSGLGGIGAVYIYTALYAAILIVGTIVSVSGYIWQKHKKK